MDRDELSERLDTVLDKLYSSRTPLQEQEELRESFFDVYRDLLEHLESTDDVLSEDDAYFFSIPQYHVYRDLLDEDVLAFIGTGAAYTLPAGVECKTEDIRELKNRLETLR